MLDKSLVYVAYSPYENQGKILDYILESFQDVLLFSIGHHDLGVGKKTNKLIIYKKGKKVKEISIYQVPLPSYLLFSILPWRSLLVFLQVTILLFSLYLKKGKMNIYFSTNGYAAWMGLVFKKIGFVSKTSYWICDYYPLLHENKIIQFIRWIYWRFEKLSAKSDILAFHNRRLLNVWKKGGAIPETMSYPLVPIGTDKSKKITYKKRNKIILVFLGVLKKSQGLDYVFNSSIALKKAFPNMKLNVLGPGPDTEYFKNRALETGIKTKFYGYVGENKISNVISDSTIGIAPYTPDPSSVSYYGDPGKIKRYISLGLPVIATNIHEFSREIEKTNAGVLVHYNNSQELVNAINKVNSNYKTMSKNATILNDKYYYLKLYSKLFAIP